MWQKILRWSFRAEGDEQSEEHAVEESTAFASYKQWRGEILRVAADKQRLLLTRNDKPDGLGCFLVDL